MLVWKVWRFEADAPPARAFRSFCMSALRRRKQILTVLAGAAVMAAAGAFAGSQLQLDDLEMRPVRGPYLHVLPGQGGGQTGVTIA